MTRGAQRGDLWSGIVLAALGAYVIVAARGWEYTGPDGPGPGFFPLWYGIAMLVLSLLLVGRSVLAVRDTPAGASESRIAWIGIRRALACWAAFMVAAALLKVAGFAITFALLTWSIVAVMFRRSQRLAWSIAIAGAALFQLLFDTALGVSLPPGLWR